MVKGERRYQIFISSTYKDLKDEREAVIKAILQNYHFPIGMEMFHADDKEQWVQIANTIDMSDFYVLILGNCCGTLMEKENISYTEKEYDYAISKGIPVLAFVIDAETPTKYFEENAKQRGAYKKFRKKVEKLPRNTWHNKEDLSLKVITTLHQKILENKRNGWIPFNPFGVTILSNISSEIVGTYTFLYYSALNQLETRLIRSKLVIDEKGNAILYNNVDCKGGEPSEFLYQGVCEAISNIERIRLL